MEKRWLGLVTIIVLFLFELPLGCAAPQKLVGVLEFEGGKNGLGRIVTDALVTEIAKDSKIRVIDRVHFSALINEQGLGYTGLVDANTAASFGKISGINYLIMGAVTDARIADHDRVLWNQSVAQVTVSMQVIEVNTGTLLFADTVNGSVEKIRTTDQHGRTVFGDKAGQTEFGEAAQDAARLLAKHLKERLSVPPFTAYVAQVDGNRIYIDIRNNQTVLPGQVFVVYKEGTAIKSPLTGEYIGRQKAEMCQISIDYVEDRMASGTILNGESADVVAGDKAVRQG